MRVLGIDLGKSLGYGLAGAPELDAGCLIITEAWWPLGPSMATLGRKIQGLIDEYHPDVIGVARPFVRYAKGGGIHDTPNNLIPQFGAFVVLHLIAEKNGIPVHVMQESEARSLLLGPDYPRDSAKAKQAVWQAILDRGRRCPELDASDAACIALGVLERLRPADSHESTPLFMAPPKRKPRRRRA